MTEALPDDDAKKGKKKKKVTLSSMEVIFDLNWPQLRSIDLNGPTPFLIEVIHPKKLYTAFRTPSITFYYYYYYYFFSTICISFLCHFFISVNVYKHICFIISALYIYIFVSKIFSIFPQRKNLFFQNIS